MNHDDYTRPDLPAVSATSADAASPSLSPSAAATQILMLLCFAMMISAIVGGILGNVALFECSLVALLALAGTALLTSIVTIASL